MKYLSKEQYEALLQYDENTGNFRWKQRSATEFPSERGAVTWACCVAGKMAGTVMRDGYIGIRINGRIHMAHRVALILTGQEISHGSQVDHLNGIRSDNRASNLRIVSASINSRNKKISSRNTSGCTGVIWDKRAKKWRAQVFVSRKLTQLGLFDDKARAANVATAARLDLGFSARHAGAI